MITLREVCENVGVSRRAVQGYEQAGLVTPTGKNKRGYLLYSAEEQEKIRQIKFFQEMGFLLLGIYVILLLSKFSKFISDKSSKTFLSASLYGLETVGEPVSYRKILA